MKLSNSTSDFRRPHVGDTLSIVTCSVYYTINEMPGRGLLAESSTQAYTGFEQFAMGLPDGASLRHAVAESAAARLHDEAKALHLTVEVVAISVDVAKCEVTGGMVEQYVEDGPSVVATGLTEALGRRFD